MTPAELDATYRGQLVGSLMTGHVEKRQIMAMLHWMDSSKGRRLSAEQAADSWVWSDLHLNHGAIISAGGRPFGDTMTMRGALLAAWRERVREDELIICLGDIAVGPRIPALDEVLGTLPGTKILIAGNHDFEPFRPTPKDYGFEAVYPTLVCETEPPLLLTHEPLEELPAAAVNVHGHLHGTAARTLASRSRHHLNVNCELTAYRPVRLLDLAATARALLAGDIEPQETTAQTIAAATRA